MRSNSVLRHVPLSRIGVIIILLLASWLIGIGIRQSWREYQVRAVVEQFTTALLNADSATAQKHLDPLLQDLVIKQLGTHNKADWPVEANAKFQISKCEVTENKARVELKIEKHGFAIKPLLTLQEFPDTGWQITDITNVKVDDRWIQFTRWQQRQKEEQLAEQLARALRDRSEIDVRRIAREELPTATKRLQ